MGLGLFATQDISRGTRILTDTAIFTLPRDVAYTSTEQRIMHVCDQLIKQGLFEEKLAEMEKLVSHDAMAAHWSVQNACRKFWTDFAERMRLPQAGIDANVARFAKLVSILIRNRTGPLGDFLGIETYFAIFPISARVNHSCQPNAHRQVNTRVGQLTVHALRDIQAGEQIFVSYLHVLAENPPEKLKRHRGLRASFVVCHCPLCRDSETTDPLLRELYLKYWGAYLLIHPNGPYGKTLDVEGNGIKVAVNKSEAVELLRRGVEITEHPLISMQNDKVVYM